MKTLIFFRHGKSDWEAESRGDHSRPVAKRGRKAARLMGEFLRSTNQLPDSVITSSAVRARVTVELAHEAGGWASSVRVTDTLYEARGETVLSEIQAEPDQTKTLLVAGHEPTWSTMIGALIGDATVRFPTAAMARIDFDVASWKEVRFATGTLRWLVPPRLLKKIGFGSSAKN